MNMSPTVEKLFSGFLPASTERQAGVQRYADAVAKVANAKELQRAGDTALANITSVDYNDKDADKDAAKPGRPVLFPPVQAKPTTRAEAEQKFAEVMNALVSQLGELSGDALKSRLSMLRNSLKGTADNNKALAQGYLAAAAEFEAGVAAAGSSEAKLAALKARVDELSRELADADTALAQAKPETPQYAKALALRERALLGQAEVKRELGQLANVLGPALGVASSAGRKAEAAALQVEQADVNDKAVKEGMERQYSAAATMVLLMSQFAVLMGESAENKLGAEQEMFAAMQASRQQYLEAKSEEYLESVRKAEAAAETMGCIGKVVGILVMIGSVIALPFTGGASAVLLGVGIALTATDMIAKEITGVSFMEQAMKPLMDEVLGPMIQAVGKGISEMLQQQGVDKESADLAGMIAGAIIGAMAMIVALAVVATVGKAAAGRLASVMGKAFGKMVPQLLKQGASAVSKGFSQAMANLRNGLGLKSDAVSLQMYSTRFGMGLAGAEAVGVASQSGMGIKAGVHQRDAAERLSEARLAMTIGEQLKAYLADMVELFDQSIKAKDEAVKKAYYVQESTYATSLNMARNI